MATPNPTNHLVVAAIDLGTSCSCYAFSYKIEPYNIRMNNNWGSPGGSEAYKCPTSVLTKPDGEFHRFGFEAEEEYRRMDPESGYQLYRNFKMDLHGKRFKSGLTVESMTGHRERALRIFGMALKFMKNHMLTKISKAKMEGHGLVEDDILWILTVPAIWSVSAKYFMREAAKEAGLIREAQSNNLMIALEPEAASLYYRTFDENSHGKGVLTRFEPGEKVLIIDAGGGTVDVTAHEVVDNDRVKEIASPSGGPWGGVQVNAKFASLLAHVFGPELINHLKMNAPQTWFQLISYFETAKKHCKHDGISELKLDIPMQFDKECRELYGKDLESILSMATADRGVRIKNGFLVVESDAVKRLFKSSIDNIVAHIEKQLADPVLCNLDYIVLVGGYGESIALQTALQDSFGKKCQVLVPLSPQLAIVKGAVLFGHLPRHIASRLSVATFGVAASLLFDPAIHDEERRYISKRNGEPRCKGTFRKMVNVGEVIKNPEVRTHIFHPKSKHEFQATIPIIASHRDDVIYSDDSDVYKVGNIILDSESTPLGEDLELKMTFGHTEILVEARDISNGKDFPVKTTLILKPN